MRFWNRSLMARLVSYFLLLSLVIVALAGALAFLGGREALKQSVADRLQVFAALEKDQLHRWVAHQRQDLVLLAASPTVRALAEPLLRQDAPGTDTLAAYARLQDYLTTTLAIKPDLKEIFILTDVGGRIVLSTNQSHEGMYRVRDSFFIEGRQDTYVQNVYPSPLTFEPTLTISTPLRSPTGERLGVLAVHINLNEVDRIIQGRAGLGISGETYLVDKYNVFISSERFGRDRFLRGVHTEGINAAIDGQDGWGLYLNYKDVPVIGVYSWIETLEMALLVEVEQAEAFAPAQHIAWLILIVGLALAVALAVGTVLLARQIAQPILRITDTAVRIADGDLTAQAPVVTEDEIGVLARTFNDMTARLRVLYDDLKQEIRERERAEEAKRAGLEMLQAIMDNSPAMIYLKDIEGRYLLANRRYATLFNIDQEAIVGKTDYDIFPEAVAEAFQTNDRAVLEAGTAQAWEEIAPQNGRDRTFLAQKFLLFDAHGQPYALCGISTDITERKEAEGLREHLIEELEAKNAELERFTYTVSHDLKSPLVTIKGFLGLLEKDVARGDAQRIQSDIRQIDSAADKMQRLLSELLELSRIGRLVNPPEAISLTDLAHEAMALVEGSIKEHGVAVRIAAEMPVVYGDRVRLLEVYQNLIENAIKFRGDQPEPRIVIHARSEHGMAVCSVADNGVGIDSKYHDKIFGLFDRLDPASEGTGIGLALVRRIVEVHGGRIWVESKGTGHGSTFHFTLPLETGGIPETTDSPTHTS